MLLCNYVSSTPPTHPTSSGPPLPSQSKHFFSWVHWKLPKLALEPAAQKERKNISVPPHTPHGSLRSFPPEKSGKGCYVLKWSPATDMTGGAWLLHDVVRTDCFDRLTLGMEIKLRGETPNFIPPIASICHPYLSLSLSLQTAVIATNPRSDMSL